MVTYFHSSGHYVDWTVVSRTALAAGHRLHDLVGQAYVQFHVSGIHDRLDQVVDSLHYVKIAALALFRMLNDHPGEASALSSLGSVLRDAGDFGEAIRCHQLSIELLRAAGERYYETVVWREFAETHQTAGDDESARKAFGEALAILETMCHPEADTVRARIRDLAGFQGPRVEGVG
jgi:tetratricopeptide (TPR) repeat protein